MVQPRLRVFALLHPNFNFFRVIFWLVAIVAIINSPHVVTDDVVTTKTSYVIENKAAPKMKPESQQSVQDRIRDYKNTEKGKKLFNDLDILVRDIFHMRKRKPQRRPIRNPSSFLESGSSLYKIVNKDREIIKDLKVAVGEMYREDPALNRTLILMSKTDKVVASNIKKMIKLNAEQADKGRKQLPSDFNDKLLRPDIAENNKEFFRGLKHKGLQSKRVFSRLDDYVNVFRSKGIDLLSAPNPVHPKVAKTLCHASDRKCDNRFIYKEGCEGNFPVGDQGVTCGSCWAFAAADSLSIAQCRKTGEPVHFSRQEFLDCSNTDCNGGLYSSVAMWLQTTKHLATEKDYPYEGVKSYCRALSRKNAWRMDIYADRTSNFATLAKPVDMPLAEWNRYVKQLISHFGSVIIHVYASTIRFIGTKPISHCEQPGMSDHAVLLTGWNVDKNGREYWIFRNSWDLWYGYRGYGHMYTEPPCKGRAAPFLSLDASLVLESVHPKPHQPKVDVPYSYMIAAFDNKDLDCSRKRRPVVVLKATVASTSEFDCSLDVTDKVKAMCKNTWMCTMRIMEQKRNTCGNVVRIYMGCGDPAVNFEKNEEESLQRIDHALTFTGEIRAVDCLKARSGISEGQIGTSIYGNYNCVMECIIKRNNCPTLTKACMEYQFKDKAKCHMENIWDTTHVARSFSDCSKAKASDVVSTATDRECQEKCYKLMREDMCENDIECFEKVSYKMYPCDYALVWRFETEGVEEKVGPLTFMGGEALRYSLKIKKDTRRVMNCEAAVHKTLKGDTYDGVCAYRCVTAALNCEDMTADCIRQSGELPPSCDYSRLLDMNAPPSGGVNCERLKDQDVCYDGCKEVVKNCDTISCIFSSMDVNCPINRVWDRTLGTTGPKFLQLHNSPASSSFLRLIRPVNGRYYGEVAMQEDTPDILRPPYDVADDYVPYSHIDESSESSWTAPSEASSTYLEVPTGSVSYIQQLTDWQPTGINCNAAEGFITGDATTQGAPSAKAPLEMTSDRCVFKCRDVLSACKLDPGCFSRAAKAIEERDSRLLAPRETRCNFKPALRGDEPKNSVHCPLSRATKRYSPGMNDQDCQEHCQSRVAGGCKKSDLLCVALGFKLACNFGWKIPL